MHPGPTLRTPEGVCRRVDDGLEAKYHHAHAIVRFAGKSRI